MSSVFQKTITLLSAAVLGLVAILAAPQHAYSAELYFSAPPSTGIGDTIEVVVRLNTESDRLNLVGGTLVFSADELELEQINDGQSAVTFWIEPPKLKTGAGASKVTFSGMIPGGVVSSDARLFSLMFHVVGSQAPRLTITNPQAFLHDGLGTPVSVATQPLQITIGSRVIDYRPRFDNQPPELFTPSISRSEAVFDGQWFVTFSAQDNQSGIDHYEIAESQTGYTAEIALQTPFSWRTVNSPALLYDQTLRSFVYVKAVDRAHQQRVVVVSPAASKSLIHRFSGHAVVIFGSLFLGVSGILWGLKKIRA